MNTKSVPDDARPLSPYLIVRGASQAIAFYTEVFGARELFRLAEPSGKIGHAELSIGGSKIMIADEYPDFGALSPIAVGGTPVALHLYVDDVDAVAQRAISAGATSLRPVKDEFFGDRTGLVADPFGHRWHLASRREDVSPAEMQERWNRALQG